MPKFVVTDTTVTHASFLIDAVDASDAASKDSYDPSIRQTETKTNCARTVREFEADTATDSPPVNPK